MHLRDVLLACALLGTVPVACSGPAAPSPGGEPPGLLAGSWEATTFEITHTSPAPGVRDLVREGSGVLLRVDPEGTCRLVLSHADGTDLEEEGIVQREGDSLWFRFSSGQEWTATHTANELQVYLEATIRGADLDGDGLAEEGTLRALLERLQVGDLSDLVGTWTAAAFTFFDLEGQVIHEDLVPQGAFFTIRFRPEGQYTAVSVVPGETPACRIGSVQRYGTVLIMSGLRNLNENDIEVHLIGGQVELTHCDDLWDFNRDGAEDEGTLTLLLDPVEQVLLGEIAGDWSATHYEYQSLEHTERLADLVSMGYAIGLQIGTDRSFRETLTDPHGGTVRSTSSVSILGNVLIVTSSDRTAARYLAVEREEGLLHLRTAAAAWDFLDIGEPEPARLQIRLVPASGSSTAEGGSGY